MQRIKGSCCGVFCCCSRPKQRFGVACYPSDATECLLDCMAVLEWKKNPTDNRVTAGPGSASKMNENDDHVFADESDHQTVEKKKVDIEMQATTRRKFS